MKKDFNEFSFIRMLRFVFYTLSAFAIYLAGHDLDNFNLKLASFFLACAGVSGIFRNWQRFMEAKK